MSKKRGTAVVTLNVYKDIERLKNRSARKMIENKGNEQGRTDVVRRVEYERGGQKKY